MQVADVNGSAAPTPSFGSYYGPDQSHGMCLANINIRRKHGRVSACIMHFTRDAYQAFKIVKVQFSLYRALYIVLCRAKMLHRHAGAKTKQNKTTVRI